MFLRLLPRDVFAGLSRRVFAAGIWAAGLLR